MTQKSLPYDNTSPGDAGPFDASSWAELWHSSLAGYNRPNAGVFMTTGDGVNKPLWVEESATPDTFVRIRSGNAQIQGFWYESNADESIEIPSNTSGNPRIDRIILRLDPTAKTIRLVHLTGTPAGSPTAPSLTQILGGTWDIPLSQIAVANLFATIVDADITDERETVILRTILEGGTNFITYSEGDLLKGNSSGSLTKLNVPASPYLLLGRTATPDIDWIDLRPTWIYSDVGDAYIATSFTALALALSNDPASNIVSLTSNQLRLIAGYYIILGGGVQVYIKGTTSAIRYCGARIQNVTNPATLVRSAITAEGGTVANRRQPDWLAFANAGFEVDGTELIELQGSASQATTFGTGLANSTYGFVYGFGVIRIGG